MFRAHCGKPRCREPETGKRRLHADRSDAAAARRRNDCRALSAPCADRSVSRRPGRADTGAGGGLYHLDHSVHPCIPALLHLRNFDEGGRLSPQGFDDCAALCHRKYRHGLPVCDRAAPRHRRRRPGDFSGTVLCDCGLSVSFCRTAKGQPPLLQIPARLVPARQGVPKRLFSRPHRTLSGLCDIRDESRNRVSSR